MGRELQKKKNRSGIQKVRQKPKSKKKLLQHPIIAQNWDKTKTLEQNYKRLGLTSKLNKYTGGREKKVDDVLRELEGSVNGEPLQRQDRLAIGARQRSDHLDVHEAQIERDPETGRITRVIESDLKRKNPLGDALAELDSDEEDWSFNQHASNSLPSNPKNKPKTEVVEKLEQAAKKPAVKYRPKQTENERAFVVELVTKYGEDYRAMARDMKINYMQRSEGDLKRRVKKWREEGGKLD